MVPADVALIVDRYLQLADQALPGTLEGLYLTGSVALADFQPGRSDIDFIAVAKALLSAKELDRLQDVHRDLATEHPKPWFSGIYVTWVDRQSNPVDLKSVPFHHESRFGRTGGFEANPSVWLTLRRYPLSFRGPARPDVWHDPAVLRQWNLDNLNSYWQGWTSRHRRLLGRGLYLLTDEALAWCVPGVSRLHYTITTGNITSKSGACQYALGTFPARWHPIIREALAIRNGERSRYRIPFARRRDALAFMQFVIDNANSSYLHDRDEKPMHPR